jgi:phosphomannomutase
MIIAPNLFKAYDIRGLVGTELTIEIAGAVGRALGDWLPKSGSVAVGYDMRPDSRDMARAVCEGLVQQGRQVIDIGEVTSDMIYFAVGHLKTAGGAMVTASHNPGQYNGIKLCREGARPISIETGLAEIRDAIEADDYREPGEHGSVTKREVMEDWIAHALSFVDAPKWPEYKIAVDTGNGMAGEVMPYLEGKTPLSIEHLFWNLDGTFPNHVANPMILANDQDLIEKVKSHELDFGVAFDGDGDRAFLVDDRGRLVPGSAAGAIMAHHFATANPGATIIYDVRMSYVVHDTIVRDGGVPKRSRVGHSFIKAAMREYDAPFAAEVSGHYYFRDNYYADSGLISALVLIDQLAKSGMKLSKLVDQYVTYSNSGELNFEVADKAAAMDQIRTKYADGTVDELDGLTITFSNWWFNIRASNTEPYLRLNVEAHDDVTLADRVTELSAVLMG